MQRDVDRLAARTYDVLVVGGGIYGLAVAYDAAARGLSVALIERTDFGSGSSFNHLRTIHGGLRYLQSLDVARARESVLERRTLAQIAPHAVRPLQFALPLYRSLLRGRAAMRAGFLLYRIVAAGHNRGVAPSLRLPGGRVLSRGEAVERFPGLRRRGLTGAAVWHDYVSIESDRLTFSWALAAAAHGAVLANYMEATSLLREAGRIGGVRAVDRQSGRTLDIGARVTVNAAGGSINRLAGYDRIPLLTAINLVTRREAGDEALAGVSPSGRALFLVPWRNRAIFGTWESRSPCTSDRMTPTAEDIDRFIIELNATFPALDLSRSDVTLVHHGAVPAVVRADGTTGLQGRERIDEHADAGLRGLVSVAGTKYTTARAVAARVVDRVQQIIGQSPSPCRTAEVPLPGGDLHDPIAAIADARRDLGTILPSDAVPHLVAAYGTRHREVAVLAMERPEWRTRLTPDSPVIGAELVWAVRHEMAVTLVDAVIRRTPLGALGHPGDAAVERAADLVGAELGWSQERRRAEIAGISAFYRMP